MVDVFRTGPLIEWSMTAGSVCRCNTVPSRPPTIQTIGGIVAVFQPTAVGCATRRVRLKPALQSTTMTCPATEISYPRRLVRLRSTNSRNGQVAKQLTLHIDTKGAKFNLGHFRVFVMSGREFD